MSQEFLNSLLDEMAKLAAANQALEAANQALEAAKQDLGSQLQASKADNQALKSQLQASKADNQALESQLQYILEANQALESQLQASEAAKTKLGGNLEHQIEVTVCLREKNIKCLGEIKRLGNEKTMLQAGQEIYKGIISDLKESLHLEQLEKNHFEKVSKNTAELYTADHNPVMFLNTLFCEPFTLEIVPLPVRTPMPVPVPVRMPMPMPLPVRMSMPMHVPAFYPEEAKLTTRC